MTPRPPLSSDGHRTNLTISLPADMHADLTASAASEGQPVGAILRWLIQTYLDGRKASMTADVARLAALARLLLQDPASVPPKFAEILRGWATDALRTTRPQPLNPDWKALADFVAAGTTPTTQPRHATQENKMLTFKPTQRLWRREMVAPFKDGGYWLVEQPGGRHWAVNYIDHSGSIYAVDGEVLADSYEAGVQTCEQDARTR